MTIKTPILQRALDAFYTKARCVWSLKSQDYIQEGIPVGVGIAEEVVILALKEDSKWTKEDESGGEGCAYLPSFLAQLNDRLLGTMSESCFILRMT